MTVKRIFTILTTAILVSFILFYAGHFLSEKAPNAGNTGGLAKPAESSRSESSKAAARNPDAVRYEHISAVINGGRQEINLLTVDVSKPGVKIMPMLSFDLVYGFESLSAMAERKSAYAAVNGGFFHEYGLPSGMVVIDGNLITGSTGRYPVFTVTGGKASLGEIKSSLWLDYGRGRLKIDRLNMPVRDGEAAVYTPYYGTTSRVHSENLTAVVKNGLVIDIAYSGDEVRIPENGILVTFLKGKYKSADSLPFKKGDKVSLLHEPGLPDDLQAYECGNWLVKGGLSVVRDKDEWVGVMTNRDPRTAVGIKKDGSVVLFTVDGRQPGYSEGFTGRELADYLLGLGVADAAMLDGGASTEMIVKGKLVGRPSFKGQERPLAGGLAVITP